MQGLYLAKSVLNPRANASGGSEVDRSNLPVVHARVEASGASAIRVQPSGTLDVEASGASSVRPD